MRTPIGPGLYSTPLGKTVHGWEAAVVDDARGNWWVVIYDGLTTHDGPTRKSPEAAALDADGLVGWLEMQCVSAKAATGMMGAN
jgi:hypothetical protein